MRLASYLVETEATKMPLKSFRYFKEIVGEFLTAHKNYKYTSINKFMKDLTDYDYKSVSVLFNQLNINSPEEFIRKYKDYVDKVNESVSQGKSKAGGGNYVVVKEDAERTKGKWETLGVEFWNGNSFTTRFGQAKRYGEDEAIEVADRLAKRFDSGSTLSATMVYAMPLDEVDDL